MMSDAQQIKVAKTCFQTIAARCCCFGQERPAPLPLSRTRSTPTHMLPRRHHIAAAETAANHHPAGSITPAEAQRLVEYNSRPKLIPNNGLCPTTGRPSADPEELSSSGDVRNSSAAATLARFTARSRLLTAPASHSNLGSTTKNTCLDRNGIDTEQQVRKLDLVVEGN